MPHSVSRGMSPGAGLASVMNMSAPIQSHHASAPDQPDTVVPPRVPWTAVVVFIVMACGLAWLVALPLWLDGSGLANPFAGLLLPVIMFTPGIAALFVVFMVQRPRPRPVAEYLGSARWDAPSG